MEAINGGYDGGKWSRIEAIMEAINGGKWSRIEAHTHHIMMTTGRRVSRMMMGTR
jgi:hypothetical protein